MLPALFSELFDWQGRVFLSEEHWSFDVPVGKAEVSSRILSRISTISKWRLHFPLADHSRNLDFRGVLEDDRLTLKPPRLGFWGSILGFNMLFYFSGKIANKQCGAKILGVYKIIPIFRISLLSFVNVMALSFAAAILFSGLLFAAGYAEQAVRSVLAGCLAAGLLVVLLLLLRSVRRVTAPSREALSSFFTNLSEVRFSQDMEG